LALVSGIGYQGTAAARAAEIPEAEYCPVKTNTAKRGAAVNPPITLTPTQETAQKLVNFGTSRSYKVIKHLTVIASKPLPAGLSPEAINFDAVLSRTGGTLETNEFPDLTFSRPYISNDGRTIAFAACLNPAGVSAGKYVGFITVGGPEGLSNASISLTVNTKNGTLFWIGVICALGVTVLLLFLKEAAANKQSGGAAVEWSNIGKPLKSPLWVGATVITLGGTFGALFAIYTNDPAWGASGFASVVSLVGTSAAAVGAHTIVTSLSAK
jgi:hypothetical protein